MKKRWPESRKMPGRNQPAFKVELLPYVAKNWITPEGVWKVRKGLEPRFPRLQNARFLTFTINREFFTSPEGAYEVGKARIRKTMDFLRRAVGVTAEQAPYCWKLEFHRDIEGWPHWHVIWLFRRPIDLALLERAWTLGNVDCKRIKGSSFRYLFKYVTKSGSLPDWVLDYRKTIRFFQSSKGFLTALEEKENRGSDNDGKEAKNSREIPFRTIREKLSAWSKMAVAIERTASGKQIFVRYSLNDEWSVLRDRTILDLLEHGGFKGIYRVVLKTLNQWKIWIKQPQEKTTDSAMHWRTSCKTPALC